MENFEDFLKNEADSFKMPPSDKVWKGVRAGIAKPKKVFVWWYAAAVLVLVSGGVILFLKYNSGIDSATKNNSGSQPITEMQKETAQSSEKAVIEKEIPANTNKVVESKIKENSAGTPQISAPKAVKVKQTKTKPEIKTPPEILNEAATKKIEAGKQSMDLFTLSPKQITLASVNPSARESLLQTDGLTIRDSEVKPADKKFNYTILTGITVSTPLNVPYSDFVKPAAGFSLQVLLGYNLSRTVMVSVGLGFQQNAYKIGVVTTSPETILLSTPNGIYQETVNYRLNNESVYKNKINQFFLPVSIHLKLPIYSTNSKFGLFTGIDFAKLAGTDYIIKNQTDDKLFSDAGFLNGFNSYLHFGATFSHRINQKMSWICSYKLQYQNGNTFKPGFNYREHLMINGLNIGVVF